MPSHACKVVRPSRRFLRQLINLSAGTQNLSRCIRLNGECQSDIGWDHRVVVLIPPPMEWRVNAYGIAKRNTRTTKCGETHLAVGVVGHIGAHYYGWLQLPLAGEAWCWSISVREVVPILLGCFVWGGSLERGSRLLELCQSCSSGCHHPRQLKGQALIPYLEVLPFCRG